ncbi:hypothetical protein ACFUCV_03900 [Specibacter sp. NPDC057265]|uniref:hypothetical protein n=1 Tax=Specibacter sp. NPDC057265 TaxID=3346075 RepID=UPI00362D03DC
MKHPIKSNAPWVDCQDPAAAQKLEQFLTLTPATLFEPAQPGQDPHPDPGVAVAGIS